MNRLPLTDQPELPTSACRSRNGNAVAASLCELAAQATPHRPTAQPAAAAPERQPTTPAVVLPPRGLTRDQAAAYAGCRSLSTFSDWIRRGLLPGPIPTTRIWDRRAIDAALDRLSGLQANLVVSPLEEWKARRRAHGAQGNP